MRGSGIKEIGIRAIIQFREGGVADALEQRRTLMASIRAACHFRCFQHFPSPTVSTGLCKGWREESRGGTPQSRSIHGWPTQLVHSRQQACVKAGRVLRQVHAHDRLHERADPVTGLGAGNVHGVRTLFQRIYDAGEGLSMKGGGVEKA